MKQAGRCVNCGKKTDDWRCAKCAAIFEEGRVAGFKAGKEEGRSEARKEMREAIGLGRLGEDE